ncbi:hypothetical protein LA080_010403 [Diaporthe eres]|nr:hypothetical protein LA080_010403 [Diaporthe eres]
MLPPDVSKRIQLTLPGLLPRAAKKNGAQAPPRSSCQTTDNPGLRKAARAKRPRQTTFQPGAAQRSGPPLPPPPFAPLRCSYNPQPLAPNRRLGDWRLACTSGLL